MASGGEPKPPASVDEYVRATLAGIEESGLTAYLKDATTLIIENRPESPVQFLAEYFRAVVNGSSPLARAYKYLRLSPPDRDAFIDNLVAAYMLLDSREGSPGLTGGEYLKLLRIFCADFPEDIVDMLVEVMACGEGDLVSFSDFLGGVKACLLFEDALGEAEELFVADCAVRGQPPEGGKVKKSMLKAIIKQVAERSEEGGGRRGGASAEGGGAGADFERACAHVLASEDLYEDVTYVQFVRVLFRAIAKAEMDRRAAK